MLRSLLNPVFESVETDSLSGGVTGGLTVGKIFGERIESQSPSGVSAAEFTSGINSDYDVYVFSIASIQPANDTSNLHLEVSTDGGSSWQTDASDYQYGVENVSNSGATGTTGSSGDSKILLNRGAFGNASGESGRGWIRLSTPADSDTKPLFEWQLLNLDGSGNLNSNWGGGAYETAEAIDAVRLLFDSGNISSGEIDLYGVVG